MSTPVPPRAEKRPHVEIRHGKEVVDEWHWLRDDTRENREVLDHLERENAYTEAVMEPTEALRERLYREMLSRIQETDQGVPQRDGDHWYYSRTEKGKNYRIQCRRSGSEDAPEQIILDENAEAAGHDYFRLGSFEVDPSGRLLAYGIDTDGGERYRLAVKDLGTGELLLDRIEDTGTSLEWCEDGRTLYYSTLDDAHRPFRIHRHRLGTPSSEDELVYEETDDAFFVHLYKTKDRKFLVVSIDSNNTSEQYLLDAADPRAELRLVDPRRPGVESFVEHWNGRLFFLTNDDAVNFKLQECPLDTPGPEHRTDVLPHRSTVKLDHLELFEHHLVVVERRDGLRGVRVMTLPDRAQHRLEFDESVYTVHLTPNPEYRTRTLRLVYQSMTTPPSVFDYDLDSRERTLRKRQPVLGDYERSHYHTERIEAVAPDGTKVPISVVHRADLKRDGNAPTLLYGYGSYGMCTDPAFDSTRLTLLDRGVVYAIAHIRGGGEMGRPWYENGKLEHKRNTFTDFIAAAEALIEAGFTRPDRLAIRGGSAGGLLVGATVNMRPDLFRAAVAKVPFVDVVNTMSDASLPLTVIEWDEWGNPAEPEAYERILAYSPYDNVRATDYPAMLVTAGLTDPRVAYWEPAKWVARLRDRKTGDRLLLLKTDMGAGHSGPSGRYHGLRELAYEYAFLIRELGIPEEPIRNPRD